MIAYYKVSKKKPVVQIGVIYGNRENIQSYYSKKSIDVVVDDLNIINQVTETKTEAIPYNNKLWRYYDMYFIASSHEDAVKAYQLYCVKEALPFDKNYRPLPEVEVVKCELVKGKPDIIL